MSAETISEFIERSLYELAAQTQYRIPTSIIPQIAHLIEKYPNLDANGSKTALSEDLILLIENVRKQGALD
jgi:hypothetical protein